MGKPVKSVELLSKRTTTITFRTCLGFFVTLTYFIIHKPTMCLKHIPGPTSITYTYLTQQLKYVKRMTLKKKWLACVGVIITKLARESLGPTLLSGPNLAFADRVTGL